jgi:hypothetical protein
MNRERAETHLRLLAEAEMRDALQEVPLSAGRWPAVRTDASIARMARVARALTDVHALDAGTAEAILADFATALGARQCSDQGRLMMRYESALRRRALRAHWSAWPTAGSQVGPGAPAPSGPGNPAPSGPGNPAPSGPGNPAPSGPGNPGPAGPESPGQGGPTRLVPLGLTVWYSHDGLEGELHLLSYSRTASGARFHLAWRVSSSASGGGFPLLTSLLGVTDDKGARYSLSFTGCGGPDWAGQIRLHPDPPDHVRWFDLAPPGGPALRVNVHPATPQYDTCPQVRQTGLAPGEHLLNQVAERLLAVAQDYPPDPRPWPGPAHAGPFTGIAAGLGDVVAALEAAGALSPVSLVPGRLAALCASLRVTGHGITAPPARDLPEPWLSLLAHYHRRKPDPAPVWDGFAAAAATLPELDGIGLALLGVHTSEGRTVLHLRASSQDGAARPLGHDLPLSVWVRDSGGRWHVAEQDSWAQDDGEYALTLRLVPPLTRSAAWIELLAAGVSAEVRARLPLRWSSRHD